MMPKWLDILLKSILFIILGITISLLIGKLTGRI